MSFTPKLTPQHEELSPKLAPMKTNPQDPLYPLPDRLSEDQVSLQLSWTADERTTRAIRRQAKLMGFPTPEAYLVQACACAIASNEETTYQKLNGELVAL